VRDDRGGEISYLLHCERSSGQYLFDALIDAGDEFGIEVDGFVDPGNRGVKRA
jgi:sarcosine oxidase, subunit gamma